MKCARCQHQNEDSARFCEECAAPLGLACVNCGRQLSPTAKFCPGCAQPTGLAPEAKAAPRFTSPDSYIPKHLAERILTSKTALEGERKQVTVLFADLKGSMELLADRDPEEARKLLDPVIEHMMEAVHRYEGTVNQVMGDGIMALFGAPLAHEDHAVRACYAALRMQESVRRYAEGISRTYGVPVEIRVGLNSGEVVVRAIGSDLRMDYTAVGQTTHLAARMEQVARPGTILLAPATLALAEGFVQVMSRGPVPVKGLTEPIEIFELAGTSPVRGRLHAAASRGLTRFVGRDAELELLRQALGQAGEGHGQVVTIVGEPGVGKSRLVWEFTHSHRSQGWLVLETASVSYGKPSTYFPVIELLRSYFGIEFRDDIRKMREKVVGKLLSLDRTLEPTLPVFLSLLDVPLDDAEWMKLDPAQRRRQTLDVLKRLLLRESHLQPVLLVVEDLHWIDSETQAWLDLLVESLPTARLLLLVNYRPEYRHAWGSKTYYQQVRLDALPMASAEALLESLLAAGPGLKDLRRLLIDRTQGNPFFLEETVRSLVETGALSGEPGAYRLAKPVRDIQLPATAHAIVAARIDRLAPEDKRLLQAAAIVGKDVPFPLLEAIADDPEAHLHQGLSRLQAAEFLYETKLFPEIEYTFKHALTHQVTYGSLLHDRRRALHGKIVDAVREVYGDRIAEWVPVLAHHAYAAERWHEAVHHSREAWRRAAMRSAYAEAAASAERALSALDRLPVTEETTRLAIDVRLELREALFVLGDIDRLVALLQETVRLAEGLGDPMRLARVLTLMTGSMWIVGDARRALPVGLRAREVAYSVGELGPIVGANHTLGIVYTFLGRYEDAARLLSANVELIGSDRAREGFGRGIAVSVASRAWIAWSLSCVGRFDEAGTAAAVALDISGAIDQPWTTIAARWGAAFLSLVRGEFKAILPVLRETTALCEAAGIRIYHAAFLAGVGRACARTGMVDEGLAALREAAAAAAESNKVAECFTLWWLADAELMVRNIEAAQSIAMQAVDLARIREERGTLADALVALSDVHRERNDRATAVELLEEAMTLGRELGMRPTVAHCHARLARLYRTTGRGDAGGQHFVAARTMYREMGMTYWLEQVENEPTQLT